MDTPFRNDVDALKTRLASLDEEVATLRGKAREYETVQERLNEAEREAEAVRREVDARAARRPTPFLDTLRIASPCNEPWENMVGDERSRFCGRCEKDVHNVSAMTRVEAEALLESVASSICVRMYQRTDGTILTADCPVGVRKKRVKRLFLATVGGGLAAAAGALAFWRYEEHVVMGDMAETRGGTEMREVAGGATPIVEQGKPMEPMGVYVAPQFATPPGTGAPGRVRVTAGMAARPEQKTVATPPKTSPGPKAQPATTGRR